MVPEQRLRECANLCSRLPPTRGGRKHVTKYNASFVFQLPLWLRSGGVIWIPAWKERTAESFRTPRVGPVAVAIKSKPLRQVRTKGNCNLQLRELLTQGVPAVPGSPSKRTTLFCVDKPARAVLHCGFCLSGKSICQCCCCLSGQWFGGWTVTFSRAPKFPSAPSGAQFKVKVSELTERCIKATWQESTSRWFTQIGKCAATEIGDRPGEILTQVFHSFSLVVPHSEFLAPEGKRKCFSSSARKQTSLSCCVLSITWILEIFTTKSFHDCFPGSHLNHHHVQWLMTSFRQKLHLLTTANSVCEMSALKQAILKPLSSFSHPIGPSETIMQDRFPSFCPKPPGLLLVSAMMPLRWSFLLIRFDVFPSFLVNYSSSSVNLSLVASEFGDWVSTRVTFSWIAVFLCSLHHFLSSVGSVKSGPCLCLPILVGPDPADVTIAVSWIPVNDKSFWGYWS